jgi:hypothetical protein
MLLRSCVFASGGICGSFRAFWYLVHLGLETSAQYFSCLGEPSAVLIKFTLGHVTKNFYFLNPEGSVGHVVHPGESGHETSMHYFHARMTPVQIRQKVHRYT